MTFNLKIVVSNNKLNLVNLKFFSIYLKNNTYKIEDFDEIKKMKSIIGNFECYTTR